MTLSSSIFGHDEMTDEEKNDNYDTNQSMNIRNYFSLEEMKNIIEWID